MLYTDFLKTVTNCQFCELDHNFIIKKDTHSFLLYSLAPYCKHHLLVIPDRHVEHFEDLNKEERDSIDNLLNNAIKLLKVLGHADYNILLRNGNNVGKSIQHLHYHIIPSMELDIRNKDRKIMTEQEICNLLEEFKEAESKLE